MAIILEVGNGIGSGECDIFFDALFLTQHNKMKERKRKRITALNGEGERKEQYYKNFLFLFASRHHGKIFLPRQFTSASIYSLSKEEAFGISLKGEKECFE
jgi:hypothetical protein